MEQVLGSQLPVALQLQALKAYGHRYTMEHMPQWARKPAPNGKYYAPQYSSDAEWLANTRFWVCGSGSKQRLAVRPSSCQSYNESWPLGNWLDSCYQGLRERCFA